MVSHHLRTDHYAPAGYRASGASRILEEEVWRLVNPQSAYLLDTQRKVAFLMRSLCRDKRKEMAERRKDKRFEVRNGAFAVLRASSWPHSTQKLGQIKDISMGGLAFSYIASEDLSNGSVQLSIFLVKNRFHLRKIPFETISDLETDEVPFSSITMRRSGVQFGELTPNQISQLKYFIQSHTIGETKV